MNLENMKMLPHNIKLILALLLLSLFGLPGSGLFGSHFAGIDYEYTCVNACTLRLDCRIYRDCSGATGVSAVPTTWTGIGTSCTAPTPVDVNWQGGLTTEVTPVCPGTVTTCTNLNATVNGYEEVYYWRQYNICSTNCNEYTISYSSCCRIPSITSGGANQSIYVDQITVNTSVVPCNNSPDIGTPPLFYICPGDTTVHDLNVTEPDGDSLVFSLAPCLQGAGNSLTYNPGYSPTTPLGPSWNVSMDPVSGDITFIPSPGNLVQGVICFVIEEYRSGQFVGRIARDFLVTPINCPSTPGYAFDSIANEVNAFSQSWTVYAVAGDSICFDFYTNTQGNSSDLYTSGLPTGAELIDPATGLPDDTLNAVDPVGRICWATTRGDTGSYQFDAHLPGGCPTSGVLEQTFTLVLVDSSELVWPGDANNDGVANMQDLLTIGLGFGNTGPQRFNASNNWTGQLCINWTDTIPGGINSKFQDCNGDSTVNLMDTIPLSLNYGLSHNKGDVFNKGNGGNPSIWVDFLLDSAMVGDTVQAKIYLGDATVPATDVYGVSCSFMYDKTLVDSGSVQVSYGGNWMGTPVNSVGMYRDMYTNGQLDLGFTRINHQNVTGNGEIATIGLILTDNIDGKTHLITEVLQTMLINVILIDRDGKNLPLFEVNGDSIVVYEIDNSRPGPLPDPGIRVYPNPTTDDIFVQSDISRIQEIEIVNLLGQSVRKVKVSTPNKVTLNTEGFRNGLYYLKIKTDQGESVKRIVIRR